MREGMSKVWATVDEARKAKAQAEADQCATLAKEIRNAVRDPKVTREKLLAVAEILGIEVTPGYVETSTSVTRTG